MNASEIFKTEALELLDTIEECVIDLEKNQTDCETINKLFRAVHTIKGSGAMFGYDDIAQFTHHLENTLDQIRSGKINLSQELIDLILNSHDYIRHLFECADQSLKPDFLRGESIIHLLKFFNQNITSNQPIREDYNQKPNSPSSKEQTYRILFKPDLNILNNGTDLSLLFNELREMGECTLFCRLEKIPPFEELNPEFCYLTWDILLHSQCTEDDVRDVFIFVEDECSLNINVIHSDEQNSAPKIGEILIERGEVEASKLDHFLKLQKPIGTLLVENKIVPEGAVESALMEQQKIKTIIHKNENHNTLRVEAAKLDSLVDLVGELVTLQARLSERSAQMKDPEFTIISEEIERLTGDLRDETMSIRMMQIGSTFNTFKRLVRDLSKELNKDIQLITSGGETELDKTVIEHLKDPLVHIIRNSLDHGIETKSERIESNKSPIGTIQLSATHSGAQVHITISDDGRGLNAQAIKNKAIEKKIISSESDLSEKELQNLIFAPGFSTAAEITDISGRGVGMDVVRQNIENLRGHIEVKSQLGQGTSITLMLPLTLAIIDGLMVSIENEFYILPLSSVEECIEINADIINNIKGRNILNVRGEAIPFILLRDLFEIKTAPPFLEQVVITKIGNKRIGLVVDRVVGSHQTVIKSLGKLLKKSEYISGATILGNGTVALIIAVNKLVDF